MKSPVSFLSCVLWAILIAANSSGESSEPVPPSAPALNLALPFEGPGQLVMIVSRGWPPNGQLVVATREGSRVLPLEKPWAARWRSSRELIVVQSGSGGWSDKVLRVDGTGKVLETIADGYFVEPEPTPDGRRLAVAHVLHDGGRTSLEIRELANGFRLVNAFPPDEIALWLSAHPTWAPDGKRLVVSIRSDDSDIGEHLQPRLAIVSPDSGTVERLYVDRKSRKRVPRGMAPIFWHSRGIYVSSARGVLRCDPEGKGCDVVYNPGDAWHVIGGTAFGADEALLLVKDVKADPLEPRAKEIHRLNLSTGKGELWVRLPDDVFVSDIDWIGDADSKQSDPSDSS